MIRCTSCGSAGTGAGGDDTGAKRLPVKQGSFKKFLWFVGRENPAPGKKQENKKGKKGDVYGN
jgi:hypothetical protein